MNTKISNVQVAQLHKLASSGLRQLSEENDNLRQQNAELLTKVAGFEKKARAEKLAAKMVEKGLEPETAYEQKVEELIARDNLDVLEEAVGLAANQLKTASVHDDGVVESESTGTEGMDSAAEKFAQSLASLDS